MFSAPEAPEIIALALAEDLGVAPAFFAPDAEPSPGLLECDVTSAAVLGTSASFEGRIVAREAAVVCGLPVAEAVWATLARAVGLDEQAIPEVFPLVAEGARVKAGTAVAEVSGPARLVLAGERTALDFVMVLSGIATQAARWQEAIGTRVLICDTRKTWPGLRSLSKYAVRVGGATNHRAGLWDMVLVKDNHLRAAGTIAEAILAARTAQPGLLVEVEADTVESAIAAAQAGADMVLLDNMDDDTLLVAVESVRAACGAAGHSCLTEASGGINYERLGALRATGVDRVSSSVITLAPPVDFGLDELR